MRATVMTPRTWQRLLTLRRRTGWLLKRSYERRLATQYNDFVSDGVIYIYIYNTVFEFTKRDSVRIGLSVRHYST